MWKPLMIVLVIGFVVTTEEGHPADNEPHYHSIADKEFWLNTLLALCTYGFMQSFAVWLDSVREIRLACCPSTRWSWRSGQGQEPKRKRYRLRQYFLSFTTTTCYSSHFSFTMRLLWSPCPWSSTHWCQPGQQS